MKRQGISKLNLHTFSLQRRFLYGVVTMQRTHDHTNGVTLQNANDLTSCFRGN